jgi:hypothetical protein
MQMNLHDFPEGFGGLELISQDDIKVAHYLGEGAYSIVNYGLLSSPGSALSTGVAIKQLRAKIAKQPGEVARFLKEAHTLACLDCPYAAAVTFVSN